MAQISLSALFIENSGRVRQKLCQLRREERHGGRRLCWTRSQTGRGSFTQLRALVDAKKPKKPIGSVTFERPGDIHTPEVNSVPLGVQPSEFGVFEPLRHTPYYQAVGQRTRRNPDNGYDSDCTRTKASARPTSTYFKAIARRRCADCPCSTKDTSSSKDSIQDMGHSAEECPLLLAYGSVRSKSPRPKSEWKGLEHRKYPHRRQRYIIPTWLGDTSSAASQPIPLRPRASIAYLDPPMPMGPRNLSKPEPNAPQPTNGVESTHPRPRRRLAHQQRLVRQPTSLDDLLGSKIEKRAD
jgi:hypothetical protein